MRAIVSDWQKFDTARMTFNGKYSCQPGDCSDIASFGIGTNGDGDGYLDPNAELYQYWSQMANAGLIEGSYTGATTGNYFLDVAIGGNVPASPVKDVGYAIYERRSTGRDLGIPNWGKPIGRGKEILVTGRVRDNSATYTAAFLANEVYSIDAKIDDGKANSGNVRTHIGEPATGFTPKMNNKDCTTPNYVAPGNNADFDYNLVLNGDCAIVYLFDWK